MPVGGVVKLDGRPLPHGSVMFRPAEGRAAQGVIDADGRFELTTYRPGDGIRPGPAVVRVACFEPNTFDAYGALVHGASLIPERYADYSTSGITIEVAPGMAPVELKLTTK